MVRDGGDFALSASWLVWPKPVPIGHFMSQGDREHTADGVGSPAGGCHIRCAAACGCPGGLASLRDREVGLHPEHAGHEERLSPVLCTCAGQRRPPLRAPPARCGPALGCPASAPHSICLVTGPVARRHWGLTRTMVPPRMGPARLRGTVCFVLKGPSKPVPGSGVTHLGFG